MNQTDINMGVDIEAEVRGTLPPMILLLESQRMHPLQLVGSFGALLNAGSETRDDA